MKIWSQLAEATKKKYRAKGVSPRRYNAWVKTTKSGKEKLAKRGVSRDDFLKASSTREVKQTAAQKQAEQRLLSVLPKPNPRTVRQGVQAMTGVELHIAITAKPDKLRSLASRRAYRDIKGKSVNPFWYR